MDPTKHCSQILCLAENVFFTKHAETAVQETGVQGLKALAKQLHASLQRYTVSEH